jgi:hypothetical protein
MHTVELLEQAQRAAERLGYGVRQEWLGGTEARASGDSVAFTARPAAPAWAGTSEPTTEHDAASGTGGGPCSIGGKRWIFVDLALNVVEQLDQVIAALREDTGIHSLDLSPGLRCLLGLSNIPAPHWASSRTGAAATAHRR